MTICQKCATKATTFTAKDWFRNCLPKLRASNEFECHELSNRKLLKSGARNGGQPLKRRIIGTIAYVKNLKADKSARESCVPAKTNSTSDLSNTLGSAMIR